MRNSITAAFVALAAAGVVAWSAAPAVAETSLKLVSMLPKKHPVGRQFGGFITRLNARFEGEFRIDWRGGPEVVPQFKQPNAVRLGSVDMTLTSPSYANGILSVSGAANYSNKQYNAVKASGYLDYMTRLHAAKGLVYIGELPVSQLRFHLFLRKPVTTLADLEGVKIRVFPAIAPAVKALGASPVVMQMTEIFTAMERGVIDGFAQGVMGIGKQYQGLLKGYIEPGFYRATFHFLANPRSWATVPEATRAKVTDFVRNTDPATFEAGWSGPLAAGYKRLAAKGIEAIRFPAEEEAKYKKLVLDAAWAAVREKAPEEGARLQSMLLK